MILIKVERPIEMSNLFVRNNVFTNHANQHIVPFMHASSEVITRVTYNSEVKNLVIHSSDMTHTELHAEL